MKNKNQKKKKDFFKLDKSKEGKRGPEEVHLETAQKMFFQRNVTGNLEAIRSPKKTDFEQPRKEKGKEKKKRRKRKKHEET